MRKTKTWAILLALVFLAAQLHFCADLIQANNNAHFCPFCSTAGFAIAPHVPTLGLAPAEVRLEILAKQISVSAEVAPSISPRAPPAL